MPEWTRLFRQLGRIVLGGAVVSLILASAALARTNSITITPPAAAYFSKQYKVTFKGFATHKEQFVYFLLTDSTSPCATTPVSERSIAFQTASGPPRVHTVRRTFIAHIWNTDLTLGDHPKTQTDTFCAYLVNPKTDAVLAQASATVALSRKPRAHSGHRVSTSAPEGDGLT